ncbi:MAG: protein-export chaperone SecB [Mariprofundaceae bacterium]
MSNNEIPESEVPESAIPTNEEAPIFSLQKIYVKDISFENPNAPAVFMAGDSEPRVEMNLAVGHVQVNDDHWEVTLKVNANMTDKKSDQLLFEVEVEHAALFFIKNIPEEHMASVLAVDSPTVIFPYTRQIISQLTVDGGFMPFLLEPVNFRVLFDNNREQAEQMSKPEGRLQ